MLDADITLLPVLFCLAFSNTPCGSVMPNPILPSYASVRTSRSKLAACIIFVLCFWNTDNEGLLPSPSIYKLQLIYKSAYKSRLYVLFNSSDLCNTKISLCKSVDK